MRERSQGRQRDLIFNYAPMGNGHAMKPVAGDHLEERRNGTLGGMETTAEEREIDRVLADSFPASDSPPWTLGVPRELATESGKLDLSAKSHGR